LRRIFPVLVIALACWVCAYSWIRATRNNWVTGPHEVTWHDATNKPLDEAGVHGLWCGGALMHDTFLVGDRMIVSCSKAFAWIDPAVGKARVAWPMSFDPGINKALAIARDGRWAIAFLTARGDDEVLAMGVAEPDGWLLAPVVLSSQRARKQGESVRGHALPLAMEWRGDAVELVLTRPEGEDEYGTRRAPEVVRVGRGITRTVMPMQCEDCTVMGALPTESGWRLVALANGSRDAVVIDERGTATPAPAELAWWAGYDHLDTDRAAVGLTDSSSPEPVLERDGSRHDFGGAPFPDFKAQIIAERHEVVDGVLRTRRIWSLDDSLTVIAQRMRGKSYVMANHDDVQLIGDHPTRMHPVVRASGHFTIGEVIPRRGGGSYFMTGDGKYVTLDDDLRRVDSLSLYEHLRQRGSIGPFIDEPGHAYRLFYVMAGLPFAFALGLILSVILRDRRRAFRLAPIAFACGVYAVTGTYALAGVLRFL